MSDLRILYVNTSTGWGGMEMHPMVVAEEMARKGSPLFFAVRQGAELHGRAKGRGVAVLALPFRWYLDPGSYPVLRRMVQSFGINVIHIHASRDTWRTLLLAGILRRRAAVIFSRHMGSPAGKKKNDPLHRLLANRVDAMVAISEYIRGNILDTYTIQASRVKVIPYGLGPSVLGDPQKALHARKRLSIPPDAPLVGMVAQISPDKRQDLLLQAAARVVQSYPTCRFVLAGAPVHGSYESRIRGMIASLGLERNVILSGFWEDIPSLMQALDVLVLPSKAEAFGLVILEAMANARPVVGSRSGAVPEIVQHQVSGLLFEPDDPEALADALEDLLRDPDKRVQMGKQGEAIFQERYRLEREVRDTKDLYQSLLR